MQTTDSGGSAKQTRGCSESSRGIDRYTNLFLALMPTYSSFIIHGGKKDVRNERHR